MRSKIIVTDDNSKTLLIPELNETYHSTKGAITEAQHVFIKEGLLFSGLSDLKIFEMGFGTGLNAIITFDVATSQGLSVDYTCVEAFPVSFEKALEMEYLSALDSHSSQQYEQMHKSESGIEISLGSNYNFIKHICKVEDLQLPASSFDIIYYDAFGPKVQGELWEEAVLKQMFDTLKDNGILITYCAQGAFKRTLKQVGFEVQAIPGPPGKREITRAIKRR